MPTAVVVSVHESVMPCIRSIRVWDLRMLSKAPVQVPPPPWLFSSPTKQALISAQVLGHGYGVKRLRWSAHAANHLLSCSYDTTVLLSSFSTFSSFIYCSALTSYLQVRLWELGACALELCCWRHHTEFATGIDWDLFAPGRVVSCGWDNKCVSWDIGL